MFRDLKEYQELQKLYESKVSKPEKLDEFTGLGVKQAVQMSKPKPKPVLTQKDQSDIKKEADLQKVLNNKKNLQKIETKAAADKKEVDFRLKNTESSEQSAKAEARPKRRRVGSPMDELNPGAARVKARFKAREAKGLSGLTGKPKGQPQLSGKERAQAMAKARIAAKNKASQPKPEAKPETKSGGGVSFGDAIKLNTPKPKGTVLNTQKAQPTQAQPTKTKPTYQSNRDKQNRLRQNQRQNQKSNPTTDKIIPKPNTGTDTEGNRKQIPQRNTGTDTQGTRKQIPQRNTGTDTETKTNTQIKKFPGSGKEINPKAKVTQTTSTNDKGQNVTTTTAKTSLQGSEASDAIKKAKERRAKRLQNANSMKNEAYEPYDIVLEYLLSTEQVATIEEANYVMTEMDAETIQGIVEEQKKKLSEGLGKAALVAGGLVAGKMALDAGKRRFDKFLNNQRGKGFGGNKRVDDTRQNSGDKKVGEKIYYGK